ncbi:mediator complex, subunit Med16 [Dipodascopsis tothii]|uniref:mediator complex, subunit Med16 n=1 Tax=Dipodascopsis tothii TaxID=44089 RepID=UPI0034CD1107
MADSPPGEATRALAYDNLQRAGCPGLISWSKIGLIAYAPAFSPALLRGGARVYTRYIHCVGGNDWQLSEPQLLYDAQKAGDSNRVTHVAWSTLGMELAVIDVQGRLSIFLHSGLMNQLACVFDADVDAESDLNAIVGFKWLNMNKPILVNNPANRQDDRQFHYSIHKTSPFGPWHPHNNRQACIAITRNGKLKFWYQQHETKYRELVRDLESDMAVEDYYSHASFTSDRDNTFVLAAYSSSRHTLKIFRIAIQWNVLATGAQQSPPAAGDWALVNVRRLHAGALVPANPLWPTLTYLEAVSPTNHPESRLLILAAFAAERGTVLQKHEVLNVPLTLHSNFDALGLRRNSIADDQRDVLRLKGEYELDKRLVAIAPLPTESTIYCAFDDGSVELRHRSNFAPYVPANNSTNIFSLFDAGFDMPPTELCVDAALSPNRIAYVIMTPAGELRLHCMRRVLAAEGADGVTATAVALALRHTISCYSNTCCDDVMLVATAVVRAHGLDSAEAILREAHRAIGFSLDLPKDVQADKFLVLPSLQKLLSFQASLVVGHGWRRNVAGRIAWATLNLRLFAFALTFTLKAMHEKQSGHDGLIRGEVLRTLLGLAKWCVDFLAFLLQDMLLLGRDPEGALRPGATSVSLVMLLSAVPRLLIRYTLRGLRGLEQVVSRSSKSDPDPAGSRAVFDKLEEILKSGPVQIALFEKLVSDVENAMRAFAQDPADRLAMEQAFFFRGQVPAKLHSVVYGIRTVFLQKIKPGLDVPSLLFYPVSWLGLDADQDARAFSRLQIDGLRKQIMPSVARDVRRCVRCGSVSAWADVSADKFSHNWTIAFQRNCVCGSAWVKVAA